MRTPTRRPTAGVLLALLILGLVLSGFPAAAAADGSAGVFAADNQEGQTTPPEETTPPGETQPPTDEEGTDADQEQPAPGEVPVWTWILAGLVLVGATAWMITRSGSTGKTAADDVGSA